MPGSKKKTDKNSRAAADTSDPAAGVGGNIEERTDSALDKGTSPIKAPTTKKKELERPERTNPLFKLALVAGVYLVIRIVLAILFREPGSVSFLQSLPLLRSALGQVFGQSGDAVGSSLPPTAPPPYPIPGHDDEF